MTRVLALALVVATACSDSAPTQPQPRRVVPTQRREIEPPNANVRPLPPYAITATEVGPYKLRQKIATLLDKLPSGPRIARFEIPGVLHASLMRAEEDGVLIGGEPTSSVAASTTSFVAIVNPDVARTEAGVAVGTPREKLGPLVADPERAFDPRIAVPESPRNARFLLEDERVIAIVIIDAPSTPREPITSEPSCPRPASTDKRFGACLTGTGELVSVEREEITIFAADGEKQLATVRVPNLLYAVPLRNPDGRDELVAISHTNDGQARTWQIVGYRFDATGRRSTVVDLLPLYQLTSVQTRWIGSDLRDIDLYLELASRPDGIEVGGLLTTRGQNDKLRDVTVISTITVPRRRATSDVSRDAGAPATPPDEPRSPADAPESPKP